MNPIFPPHKLSRNLSRHSLLYPLFHERSTPSHWRLVTKTTSTSSGFSSHSSGSAMSELQPLPRIHPHVGTGTNGSPIVLDDFDDGTGIADLDFTCAICLDDSPSMTDVASISGCMHKFCFDCIEKWAETENSCPCCKTRFRTIDRVVALPPSPIGDAAATVISDSDRSSSDNSNSGRINSRTVEDRHQPSAMTSVSTVHLINMNGELIEQAIRLLSDNLISGGHRRFLLEQRERITSINQATAAILSIVPTSEGSSDSMNTSASEASTLSGDAESAFTITRRAHGLSLRSGQSNSIATAARSTSRSAAPATALERYLQRRGTTETMPGLDTMHTGWVVYLMPTASAERSSDFGIESASESTALSEASSTRAIFSHTSIRRIRRMLPRDRQTIRTATAAAVASGLVDASLSASDAATLTGATRTTARPSNNPGRALRSNPRGRPTNHFTTSISLSTGSSASVLPEVERYLQRRGTAASENNVSPVVQGTAETMPSFDITQLATANGVAEDVSEAAAPSIDARRMIGRDPSRYSRRGSDSSRATSVPSTRTTAESRPSNFERPTISSAARTAATLTRFKKQR